MHYRLECPANRYVFKSRLNLLYAVVSLGLVSPGAATDGVTRIFYRKKTDDLF